MSENYIVKDHEDYDEEEFQTLEECRKWIFEQQREDDGSSLDLGDIGFTIYKKIEEYELVKTDEKKNYPCLKNPEETAHCSDCENKNCEGADDCWPHGEYDDYVVGFKVKVAGESNE